MDVAASLNQALAGRYDIEREVGQGGMATVYLARDIRHNRRVALKVLHPDLAAALGAERFVAEITTTANLQHPHILPLHDSGDADGYLFYVMPYVEGETLRARLQREQLLPVEDAVRLAREILSALDYAHRHGVVHRDIKPENILLHDGSALVADFGISLAVSAASGPRMTQTGLSLGTPSYMSPEQAMGDRVDRRRADIYATGATLYEMLIGEPPFTGPTSQAVVARLLTEEPRSLVAQRKMIPLNVDAAVRKALQKLPADRFASAADMSSAIGRAEFTIDSATATVRLAATKSSSTRRMGILIGTAIVAGVAGAVVGAKLLASDPVAEPPTRFSFDAPAIGLAGGVGVAISPDGSRIVYALSDSVGTWSLAVRSLDSETPTVLAGTKMGRGPVFSPDGRQIAFQQDGKLQRMSLDGGATNTIMALPTGGAIPVWVSDDAILVFGRAMRRVSPAGAVIDTIATDSAHGPFTVLRFFPGEDGDRFGGARPGEPGVVPLLDARSDIHLARPRGIRAENRRQRTLAVCRPDGNSVFGSHRREEGNVAWKAGGDHEWSSGPSTPGAIRGVASRDRRLRKGGGWFRTKRDCDGGQNGSSNRCSRARESL
jgi:serine/threonine-protein kinase